MRSSSGRSGIAELAESAKPDGGAPPPYECGLATAPRADRRADGGEAAESSAGRRLRRAEQVRRGRGGAQRRERLARGRAGYVLHGVLHLLVERFDIESFPDFSAK